MRTRKEPQQKPTRKRPPASTPEARQNQLIAMAYDLAEEQFLNRNASSQVLTHFLKLGSIKEQKELLLLEQEIKLKEAKTESIQSGKRVEELYSKALNAMKSYSGQTMEDDDD